MHIIVIMKINANLLIINIINSLQKLLLIFKYYYEEKNIYS